MPSDRQIRANRANALKSTGPKTGSGKAQTSRNALRHGLTARQVVLDDESLGQFESMRQEIIRGVRPDSAFEWQLTEYISVLLWRLKRASRYEAALFQAIDNEQRLDPSVPGITLGGVFIPTSVRDLQHAQNASECVQHVETRSMRLGRVVRSALGDPDLLSRLGRYEAHLLRQIEKTRNLLR